MEEKERSLKEIVDNPEDITDKEKRSIVELYKSMQEMKNAFEPYQFSRNKDYSAKKRAENFYLEHLVMANILDAFVLHNAIEIDYKQLNYAIYNLMPYQDLQNVPITVIRNIIKKMIMLELITPIETDNKYNPKFKMTEDGANILQQQTYQSIAATSFFNYQSLQLNENMHQLNRKVLRLNRKMAIISVLAVIIAIISIVVAILLK